jgi:hypothetical protein
MVDWKKADGELEFVEEEEERVWKGKEDVVEETEEMKGDWMRFWCS